MDDQSQDFAGPTRLAQLSDMIFDQIRKLAELRDAGALTDEEFAAKKTELLSRI